MASADGNTRLINAITGFSISTNIQYFINIDDLKGLISQQWEIPPEEIFLLCSSGTKFTKQIFQELVGELASEDKKQTTKVSFELCVFDRRLFHPTGEGGRTSFIKGPKQEKITLVKPLKSPIMDEGPDLEENISHRKAVSLIITNSGWLSALEIDVRYFQEFIVECMQQSRNIGKSLSAVFQYLNSYSTGVEKLYTANETVLNEIRVNELTSNWQRHYHQVLNELDAVGSQGKLSQFLDFNEMKEVSHEIVELEKALREKLQQFKDIIDKARVSRSKIAEKIDVVIKEYQRPPSTYDMEASILTNFDEMVESIKKQTHEVSDGDFRDTTKQDLTIKMLRNLKSSAVPNIYTIALSLFTQASECIDAKTKLQEKVIALLEVIAANQVDMLVVRDVLLQEVKDGVERLQYLIPMLLRVNDLPVAYGLYLIEKYRRKKWHEELRIISEEHARTIQDIIAQETKLRDEWAAEFSPFSSLFEKIKDVDYITRKTIPNLVLQDTDDTLVTAEAIEGYISILAKFQVEQDALRQLKLQLQDATKSHIHGLAEGGSGTFDKSNTNMIPGDNGHNMKETVEAYNSKIKKLESQLNNSQRSSVNLYPSSLSNTSMLSAFQPNISSINEKLMSSEFKGKHKFASSLKFNDRELQPMFNDLQKRLDLLTEENITLQQQNKTLKSKLVNIEDERNAYKETLAILNVELSKLISSQESQKAELYNIGQRFKEDLDLVAKENKALLNSIDGWKRKHDNIHAMKEDLLNDISKMQSRFATEKLNFEKELESLHGKIASPVPLQATMENKSPKTNRTAIENSTSKMDKLKEINRILETNLYDIFSSNVFILENIGLLLSRNQDNQLQILRVKGLKKRLGQSHIDEDSMLHSVVVQSSVYQEVKDLYSTIIANSDHFEKHQMFSNLIRQLYSQGLFETSVVKRFSDVETLAKKLRRENKSKKTLIEKYDADKITVKNLKVGDLALFLPTKCTTASVTSSASSLASAFSSVDLSTPPLGVPSFTRTAHSGHIRMSTIPWAAFTASEVGTRYFLRCSEEQVRGRDWLVGRIKSMEKHTAHEEVHNQYKLPAGMVWYEVVVESAENS
ncbi:HBL166Cp [Eremothecium sinecaudum]|uniref:Autophagy-related protein 11 n=1 Tax=Eremothecium sinecaudum TaxID=45286 RepID=A0A120K0W6_9SACH|nr:HBL166Cp [Eremothecium sinecaudum]AMD18736.1 HBL166Cp [Eremothecium sinecaudum]